MLKNKISRLLLIGALAGGLVACEDPDDTFNPKNPNLAVDAVEGTINSAARLLGGTERQLALVMNEVVPATAIASDNYINTRTFFNQFLDNLNIDATDDDIDDMQFAIADMRELALTGLTNIGPADPNYTDDQAAQFRFFEGFSYLLAGELFKTLPAESGGVPLTGEENLQKAVETFTEGLRLATDVSTQTRLTLARARANYFLGNKSAAVADAQAALDLDPDFVFFAKYDALNGPTNTMQDALFDRGSFDDLQPLPKLDFLDPKYNGSNATEESDIPVLKAEEAYLILIEAELADGDLDGAQDLMKDLIDLVETRPTETFDDSVEGRTHQMPGSRPDTAVVVVKTGDGDFRTGLVLDRDELVTVPTVSGTSVTDDMVDDLDNIDEALETLYLMRQEIFIAEGRRMTDLGVRLVTSQIEFLANENVTEADKEAVIPPFIAAAKDNLDAFTYDRTTYEAIIPTDFNEIIVDNKESDFVVPFF